jgi:hypothetical protein
VKIFNNLRKKKGLVADFLGVKFSNLPTEKKALVTSTKVFFWKKMAHYCHIMRKKILKSPYLDNRLEHVTKI